MQANLCRPAAATGAARLVVIAHGSPPRAAARPGMRLIDCGAPAVRWFTGRGYAVAVFPAPRLRRDRRVVCGAKRLHRGRLRPIRIGGRRGTSPPQWTQPRPYRACGRMAPWCWGNPRAAGERSPMIASPIPKWPGSSAWPAGGAATSMTSRTIIAIRRRSPRPPGSLGRRPAPQCSGCTPPMTAFSPRRSRLPCTRPFTGAGGRAELHQVDAYGEDGHRLFFGPDGAAVWGPLIAGYLQRMNLPP